MHYFHGPKDARQVANPRDTEAEAEMLLFDAGRCFQAVLEGSGDDPRAFRNWAVALRAQAGLVGCLGCCSP